MKDRNIRYESWAGDRVTMEVVLKIEYYGLPGSDSVRFAVECIEEALQNSDKIPRYFTSVSVKSGRIIDKEVDGQ